MGTEMLAAPRSRRPNNAEDPYSSVHFAQGGLTLFPLLSFFGGHERLGTMVGCCVAERARILFRCHDSFVTPTGLTPCTIAKSYKQHFAHSPSSGFHSPTTTILPPCAIPSDPSDPPRSSQSVFGKMLAASKITSGGVNANDENCPPFAAGTSSRDGVRVSAAAVSNGLAARGWHVPEGCDGCETVLFKGTMCARCRFEFATRYRGYDLGE
ncbi:uncharacterized protein EV422DRAFT_534920 [Fimicolochytrium jonesii]|uniref:uncharacterized protein n=1 Tax=Fimicolochytrium jonesii TaxID=1396493 RepID=UPI0022FE5833|nr:uncharacterized protein EV422DRAFT_534920 [Fimicolochytrium jonesii]KAI8819488.1 hypothetical protein EV422DRAFT_534920 [Fimicolochytrium jonesii]